MERKVYLQRYRLYYDQIGLPVVIRRSASEGTFRGEDLRTGQDVAVQMVPVTASRTFASEQLEAEAKAAREFNHINIPALQDFGFDDDHIIYVTEFFSGTTAEDWVKTKGPMPVGAVLRIALQVVNATSAATFHGLVHHAINPSNIIIVPGQTNEGEGPLIKVINLLGVSANVAPKASRDPASADPINFVSPEQLQTGAADFRSQIYSLGATLWFLLTGAAPVDGAREVQEAGRLPAAVRNLLGPMLADDPENRPFDPLALQAQIQDCLVQLDRRDAVASRLGLPLASEATAPKKTARKVNLWRPIALAALLLGLVAVTAVILATHFRPQKTVGVEIGVSENSAVPQPSTPPVATAAKNPSPVEEAATVVSSSPAQETPVLTSTAEAPASDDTTSSDVENNSEPSVEVAVSPSSEMESAATTQTVEEPGRVPETSAPPEQITEAPPPPAPVEKPIARDVTEEASATTKARVEVAKPKTSPAIARSNERPNQTARVAKTESELTPAPRNMERAQFLGMTPDGNLVYGSSSSGKTLSAPPVGREVSPRRKPSPRPTPASIDGLPVRPALPPDE